MSQPRAALGAQASGLRLVLGSMVGGAAITSVCAVLLFFASPARSADAGTIRAMELLSLIDAAALILSYPASAALFKGLARGAASDESGQRLRSAFVVRAAVREAGGLLGATITIICALNGSLASEPALWLNLLSPAVFAFTSLLALPTEASLQDLLSTPEINP